MHKLVVISVFSVFMAGCSSQPKVKPAEEITFKEAMKQIAEGLDEFSKEKEEGEESKQIYGLVPSEVEATFNVSVISKSENETSITLDPTNIMKEFSSLTSKWKYEGSDTRGNKITIKFRNVLFAKKGEAIYDKDKDIANLLKALKEAGIEIRNVDLSPIAE